MAASEGSDSTFWSALVDHMGTVFGCLKPARLVMSGAESADGATKADDKAPEAVDKPEQAEEPAAQPETPASEAPSV